LKKRKLVLHVPGAASEQLKRGLEAARRVFREEGATAWDAATAMFKRNAWDELDPDPVELTPHEDSISHVWEAAEYAARIACCGSIEEVPPDSYLQIRWLHKQDEPRDLPDRTA
jgi:hypothetical protein